MEEYRCQITEELIREVDCLEISEIANNCIVERVLNDIPYAASFKDNPKWKEICRGCKHSE